MGKTSGKKRAAVRDLADRFLEGKLFRILSALRNAPSAIRWEMEIRRRGKKSKNLSRSPEVDSVEG